MAGSNSTKGRVKLTAAFVSSIKPTGRRESYRDATVPGLMLRVSPDGASRVWYLDYRRQSDQKRCLYRIGPLSRFSMKSAKDEARRLLGRIADGSDPAGEKAEARRQKAEAKSSKARSRNRTLSAYLEGDYWRLYLCHRRAGITDRQRIRAAWKPFLDNDMADLEPKALEEYRATKRKAGLTASTLNRDRAVLLSLLNQAVKDGVLESNPLAMFPRLKQPHVGRVRYLTDDELPRFRAALARQPQYFQVFVRLALNTGMRRGELLKLTWRNVDLSRNQITVTAATAKSQRTRHIPINAATRKLLTDWRRSQKVTDLSGHVFINPATRKRFKDVKRRWAALLDDAGIEDFRLHDTRHDFASRIINAGESLFTVGDLLGHASPEMTKRYAHIADETRRNAAEKAAW